MVEWANWCNNPNGLFGMFPDCNYRKLRVPLLSFSFSDDWHCPNRAVQELLNHFANALVTWYHIRPAEIGVKRVGHSGFFDTRMKTILWMKLLQWVKEDDRKEKPTTLVKE
jgi:predicted alpha/beta hydrolase